MIITIDGEAGTGKSTVAKKLAERLGFVHFETGAMYRAFTLFVQSHHIDYNNAKKLAKALENFNFEIELKGNSKQYLVNGDDVTEAIREPQVTEEVSTVAAIPEVRHKLVAIQKQYGYHNDSVFEGRDLGTVVFPDAELKLYFVADSRIRAERRYKELLATNPSLEGSLKLQDVEEQILKRDKLDSERDHSPLKQADDAKLIDTSLPTPDQVVEDILKWMRTLPLR